MALKGHRQVVQDDITRTLDVAADPGVGVVLATAGSGHALGDSAGGYTVAANPSGYKFGGVLLTKVVNIDTTLYHMNFHKDESLLGDKVCVLKKGWVVTDKVTGSAPLDGDKAYLTANGVFTKTVSSTGGTVATPEAGRFEGVQDEDGYIKLEVNVPQN